MWQVSTRLQEACLGILRGPSVSDDMGILTADARHELGVSGT